MGGFARVPSHSVTLQQERLREKDESTVLGSAPYSLWSERRKPIDSALKD